MTTVLGLYRTNSRISVTSIASVAESTNSKKAYKQFCKILSQNGVPEDIIHQKEKEILEILKSQSMAATSQIGGSNVEDQGQLLGAGCSNEERSLHMSSH